MAMNNLSPFYSYLSTPLGLVEIGASETAIVSLFFCSEKEHEEADTPLLERASQQIREYFAGSRTEFDLPLSLAGTPFQVSVWQALQNIPYGRTVSYGQVAQIIGRPKAVRAVGAANGQNPVSIIVPCHRVVGADGSLIGYGGGLDRKEWLLDHERQHSG
jgi:methylated-DNA-[protein]-cysteine S-methyltransferase